MAEKETIGGFSEDEFEESSSSEQKSEGSGFSEEEFEEEEKQKKKSKKRGGTKKNATRKSSKTTETTSKTQDISEDEINRVLRVIESRAREGKEIDIKDLEILLKQELPDETEWTNNLKQLMSFYEYLTNVRPMGQDIYEKFYNYATILNKLQVQEGKTVRPLTENEKVRILKFLLSAHPSEYQLRLAVNLLDGFVIYNEIPDSHLYLLNIFPKGSLDAIANKMAEEDENFQKHLEELTTGRSKEKTQTKTRQETSKTTQKKQITQEQKASPKPPPETEKTEKTEATTQGKQEPSPKTETKKATEETSATKETTGKKIPKGAEELLDKARELIAEYTVALPDRQKQIEEEIEKIKNKLEREYKIFLSSELEDYEVDVLSRIYGTKEKEVIEIPSLSQMGEEAGYTPTEKPSDVSVFQISQRNYANPNQIAIAINYEGDAFVFDIREINRIDLNKLVKFFGVAEFKDFVNPVIFEEALYKLDAMLDNMFLHPHIRQYIIDRIAVPKVKLEEQDLDNFAYLFSYLKTQLNHPKIKPYSKLIVDMYYDIVKQIHQKEGAKYYEFEIATQMGKEASKLNLVGTILEYPSKIRKDLEALRNEVKKIKEKYAQKPEFNDLFLALKEAQKGTTFYYQNLIYNILHKGAIQYQKALSFNDLLYNPKIRKNVYDVLSIFFDISPSEYEDYIKYLMKYPARVIEHPAEKFAILDFPTSPLKVKNPILLWIASLFAKEIYPNWTVGAYPSDIMKIIGLPTKEKRPPVHTNFIIPVSENLTLDEILKYKELIKGEGVDMPTLRVGYQVIKSFLNSTGLPGDTFVLAVQNWKNISKDVQALISKVKTPQDAKAVDEINKSVEEGIKIGEKGQITNKITKVFQYLGPASFVGFLGYLAYLGFKNRNKGLQINTENFNAIANQDYKESGIPNPYWYYYNVYSLLYEHSLKQFYTKYDELLNQNLQAIITENIARQSYLDKIENLTPDEVSQIKLYAFLKYRDKFDQVYPRMLKGYIYAKSRGFANRLQPDDFMAYADFKLDPPFEDYFNQYYEILNAEKQKLLKTYDEIKNYRTLANQFLKLALAFQIKYAQMLQKQSYETIQIDLREIDKKRENLLKEREALQKELEEGEKFGPGGEPDPFKVKVYSKVVDKLGDFFSNF